MGRRAASLNAASVWRSSFLALLFLCAISIGCDNSCVIFVSNPSSGTISVDTATCSINKIANAMVRVRFMAGQTPLATPWSARVQHIFVTVRGVEARLAASEKDASADWQEWAPQLAKRPMQMDLMPGSGGPPSPVFLGEGEVRAGAYTRVRLLLMCDASSREEPTPETNACAGAGFNCVVGVNGGIQPLAFAGSPQILIPADQSGGIFTVLPDTKTDLDLELSPRSSLTYMPGSALWLNPVFTARLEFSALTNAERTAAP
jgi:hypothetical protein